MPKISLKLNKQNLYNELNKIGVDDFTLFRHYLGFDFKLGKLFKSPTRPEGSGSAGISLFNGKLYYKDFGEVGKGLDIFKFIVRLNNYPDNANGFIQAYSLIVRDFNLTAFESFEVKRGENRTILLKEREESLPSVIRYRSREWFTWEIDNVLWIEPYNITKEDIIPLLELFKVNALTHFWVNGNMITCNKVNPSYSYSLGYKRKIYSPLSKFKWINNISKDDVIGLDTLLDDEILVFESSLKDCIYSRLLGINCIPFNSENTFPPESITNRLRKKYKCIYHPNNDIPGINAGEEFKKLYNIPYFINPLNTPKDTTDYWKKYGKDNTREMILNGLRCLE